MKSIYLDNNATTQIDPIVVEVMLEELKAAPSNPSSIHTFGRDARRRLSQAREQIASFFKLPPKDLVFTASGSEALHLGVHGLQPKGTILTSKLEHSALYKTLEQTGLPIEYLTIDRRGHVDIEEMKEKMGSNIGLIALSGVNSETGVQNPVEEIGQIASHYNVPFLVDAVAWLGKAPIECFPGVTAMTFSAHKVHGPKGVGLLALQKPYTFTPQILGGSQEAMRRAGTENLAGILGFAKAIELLTQESIDLMTAHRHYFEEQLIDVTINGTGPRVCNTTSVTFHNQNGENLLIGLDQAGIMASMGSACSSGALEPSRILLNMGLSKQEALSTIRFSLSRFTTKDEIDTALSVIKQFETIKL